MLMPDNHAQAHLDLADLNERTQAALAPLRLALTEFYATRLPTIVIKAGETVPEVSYQFSDEEAALVQQTQDQIQAILQDAWEESLDIKQRCGVLM